MRTVKYIYFLLIIYCRLDLSKDGSARCVAVETCKTSSKSTPRRELKDLFSLPSKERVYPLLYFTHIWPLALSNKKMKGKRKGL